MDVREVYQLACKRLDENAHEHLNQGSGAMEFLTRSLTVAAADVLNWAVQELSVSDTKVFDAIKLISTEAIRIASIHWPKERFRLVESKDRFGDRLVIERCDWEVGAHSSK